MILRRFSTSAFFLLLFGCLFPVTAQDADALDTQTAERLLREALSLSATITVSGAPGHPEPWSTDVVKITLPGRAVTLGLEGGGAHLEMEFTPFPGEDGKILLVVRSESWLVGDLAGSREDFQSTLSSIPLDFGERVLYYPLGRVGQNTGDGVVEVSVALRLQAYLETLSAEDRGGLFSALDQSAEFNIAEGER